MKRSTVILLVEISAVYFAVLIVFRGFLPGEVNVPYYFLVVPLLVVVIALAVDLSGRATNPSDTMKRTSPPRKLGRGIETLTKQIKTGATSSEQYYETILLNRLRDVIAEKVSLETGREIERTKETLTNKLEGPSLLHDRELYTLLYRGAPPTGPRRLADLDRTVNLIEAWKP